MTELSPAQIEEALKQLPKKIYDADQLCIQQKELYLQAKIDVERAEALAYMTAKAKALADKHKPSATELKMIANKETYEQRLKLLEAEAIYQRKVSDRTLLEHKFIAIRKITELKKIAGGGVGG